MTDFVASRGDKNSSLVCIGYAPTDADEGKGICFMDWQGWMLDKMFKDAGLPLPWYVTMQPLASQTLPDNLCFQALVTHLQELKPTFILTCDSVFEKGESLSSPVLENLVPATKGQLSKYVGSLLNSPHFQWPHYVLPIYSPVVIQRNYAEKDICQSLDLGKLGDEYKYWKKNGRVQPLLERELICEPTFPILMDFLKNECEKATYLSSDIETIRAGEKSEHFKKGFGIPYTLSLAVSPTLGISFSLWDYTLEELTKIWRQLDHLFRTKAQIGQNYFLFDIIFLEVMGLRFDLSRVQDLIIRHHILWPELPHSLQFQTRQYTRQPYYKDEGKHWKPSEKRNLMHYNALDTTVAYEIFLAQEEEFKERPHLLHDPRIEEWSIRRESQLSI